VSKAFDSVPHDSICQCLAESQLSYKIISIIQNLLLKARYVIQDKESGEIVHQVLIKTGVLQGEPMSGILFNLYLLSVSKKNTTALKLLKDDQLRRHSISTIMQSNKCKFCKRLCAKNWQTENGYLGHSPFFIVVFGINRKRKFLRTRCNRRLQCHADVRLSRK